MRKSRFQAQGLIFGGLMAALVVIFAAVPFLSFFTPLPIVMAYLRHGGRTAILTATVAGLFSFLLLPPSIVIFTILPMGLLPGLAMGLCFTRRWRPFVTGVLVALLFLFSMAGEYAFTYWTTFQGRDPMVAMVENPAFRPQYEKLLDQMVQQAKAVPSTSDQQKQTQQKLVVMFEGYRKDPGPLLWSTIPLGIFGLGGIFAWVNLLLTSKLLPRFGYAPPPSTPFAELRLPPWITFVYLAVVMGVQLVLTKWAVLPWWMNLVQSLLGCLMLLFMLIGLSVGYGWLRKRDVPKFPALLMAGATVVILNQWVVLIATWDAIFDFRGLGHGTWRRPAPKS